MIDLPTNVNPPPSAELTVSTLLTNAKLHTSSSNELYGVPLNVL